MSVGQDAAGVVLAALSVLLVLAGAAKLRRPQPAAGALQAAAVPFPDLAVRALALLELAVGIAGLVAPAPLAGWLVAGLFGGLAVGAAVLGRELERHPCGCFGDADGPPVGRRQVLANAVAALLAALAARSLSSGLVRAAVAHPARGAVVMAVAMLIARAARAWLRGSPVMLDRPAVRLAESSARLLEARFSRRTALVRVAVAGSALSVAPLRYLLYPGTALAVVAPSNCGGGLCTDGYTAFCCEINHGVNGCPTGTFPGGWWMCTDYRGTQLCSGSGVRYYVDCNALPGKAFAGGCRCAGDDCDNRRVACNVFRYGQCNTEVVGTTAVVCRMVTCENPGLIGELNCSTALMVDNAVCAHEAGCLEPFAVQLPGAGGA